GWNAAQVDQAEDRIHRIGQEGSVTAWYIVAEGTIETELMEMIEQKRALATEITEGIGSASAREALERIIKTLLDE
nr:ATP-dependent helicase [Thermotogota bacterium]